MRNFPHTNYMDRFWYALFHNTHFVEPTWRPSACQTRETPLRISFTVGIRKAGSINTKTRQKNLILIYISWYICSSVQWLGHGIGNRKIGVRFSAGGAQILFLHKIWPRSTSCSMRTKVTFPGSKAAGPSNRSHKTAPSSGVTDAWSCRLQLKCDGTRWRTGGEVKGKLVNGMGSQNSSHYLGTWCIQHYYRWCAHLSCQ